MVAEVAAAFFHPEAAELMWRRVEWWPFSGLLEDAHAGFIDCFGWTGGVFDGVLFECGEVVGAVEVAADLPDVASHVEEAVFVGWK